MTFPRFGHTGLIKGSLKILSPEVSAGVWTQLHFGQVLSKAFAAVWIAFAPSPL